MKIPMIQCLTLHLFGGQHDYFRGKTGSPQMVMTISVFDLMRKKAKFRFR